MPRFTMRKTPGVIGSLQRSTRRSSATDWPSSGVIVLAERLELLDILSIIVGIVRFAGGARNSMRFAKSCSEQRNASI
jgi:hypothetical protein